MGGRAPGWMASTVAVGSRVWWIPALLPLVLRWTGARATRLPGQLQTVTARWARCIEGATGEIGGVADGVDADSTGLSVTDVDARDPVVGWALVWAVDHVADAEVLPGLGDFDRHAITDIRAGDEDDVPAFNPRDPITLLADILDFDLADIPLRNR